MCMGVLPACMSVNHLHAWDPRRPEDDIRSPETGVIGGCKLLPYGCWELNLGPLEEQTVLLTTKLALQPHHF